jgi:hypothetical protein
MEREDVPPRKASSHEGDRVTGSPSRLFVVHDRPRRDGVSAPTAFRRLVVIG